MFAAGVIAVLAVYPVRLVRTTLPLWAFAVIAAVIGHLQLGDMAISGFYTANAIQFVTFLVFAGWQWRATRKQPLQRAALGWISLSMFVGVIFFLMLITVPVLVGGEPLITQTTGLVSIVFMYAGISLGVLRFRLFDLDRWWFRTWTWLFSGAAVVAVDLVLTRLLQLQHSVALVVALIVVGWVYFPVRQRMVERISRRGVPRALDARALISAASLPELRDELERALASTFTPLEILATDAQLAAPRLAGDGAWLEVPIPTGGTFRCHFRDAGTRLFARDDVARAADLVTLAESVRLAIEARTEGELAERARIRRDLHDDLGASIIRIAQDAPDARTAHLAKLAMRDLRDVLTALHDEPTECMDLLEDLEAELRARAQAEGRDIEWTVHGSRSQVLPARHCANLTRVLRESMTNALRHGTGDVRYVLELDAEGLRIVGTNAVTPAEPGANDRAARPEPGFGLGNIAARMKELGGTASSHRDLDRFRLELSLPWSTDR
jgi:signal transduction histidine kinase